LKDPSTKRNISIQAIGLSLYESLPGTTAEQLGSEVIRTQWLYDLIIGHDINMDDDDPFKQGTGVWQSSARKKGSSRRKP
jgi:hypothetical protein